jgi:hypothetical protein
MRLLVQNGTETLNTFLLQIRDGKLDHTLNIDVDHRPTAHERTKEWMDMIAPVAHLLPDVSVIFTLEDLADDAISMDYRETLIQAASEGVHLDDGYATADLKHLPSVCPRYFDRISPTNKSFIASHILARDMCLHPASELVHGATLRRPVHPKDLGVVFLGIKDQRALQSTGRIPQSMGRPGPCPVAEME